MRNFTCVLTSRLFNLQLVTILTSKVSALHINVKLRQCFFLPETRQIAREAVFWAYFDFFLGQKSAFSPTFSRFFGSFLAHFRNFSPTLFDFFLGLTINFLGHNSEIFLRQKYFFSRSP